MNSSHRKHVFNGVFGLQGSSVLSPDRLAELDARYRNYLIAMRALDARKTRGLMARNLSVQSAIERLERLTMRQGADIVSLRDVEFFRHFINNEQKSCWASGKIHDCARFARAVCLVLEKRPELVASKKHRQSYMIRASVLGLWAAWHSRLDDNSRIVFYNHLKTATAKEPDLVGLTYLAYEDCTRGIRNDDYFLMVDAEKGDLSLTLSLCDLHDAYWLADAAAHACQLGAPLQRASLTFLGGRTPEEAFKEFIDANTPNSHAAVGGELLARAQAMEGRVDEAKKTLLTAREGLVSCDQPHHWAELRVEECDAYLMRIEWTLQETPAALVRYVKQVERTAALADEMNLPGRANSLREQLVRI